MKIRLRLAQAQTAPRPPDRPLTDFDQRVEVVPAAVRPLGVEYPDQPARPYPVACPGLGQHHQALDVEIDDAEIPFHVDNDPLDQRRRQGCGVPRVFAATVLHEAHPHQLVRNAGRIAKVGRRSDPAAGIWLQQGGDARFGA
ncbi:MAG: hypothetical protein HZC22_03640 [Rhodocyclales bacterium]|nr:hypothetical protein [Rhodocyclales bacterium]